ncbi:hypothetical protein A3A49_01875 [Candidatus Curtissbacteria bacterium RIFCSPLOWO2_01_FULL_38_11b]|uniref:D-glycerate dehydrogenase n=1 Tax=Candidatus Curtissbacteria bacterium RIFCSPLOWO2_01_FULL_38_11b TaxID=1797725 RepID=A0A1F5H1P8_9BACT|nr:MAG: hypothetical protein A3A49_01875 [Candidatus Curtissbacteria bacterium RIFCSPLOWO2_01_FULL_38_11b]
MPKIYITDKIPENGIQLLRLKGYDVETNQLGKDISSDDLKRIFSSFNAVITMVNDQIDEKIIKAASTKLKVIANFAVGYDNIDLISASKKGIIVTNTPGVASESVAEHTFALIFALNKQILAADRFVGNGQFKKFVPNLFLSRQLWGQTIGIIGLGRIGTFVGQIAYGGFRMQILYFDIKRSEDFELIYEAKLCELDTILKDADIVTLHVPLSKNTHHLIGKRELKLMKDSAILINTARGLIVDEEALVWALKSGEIAGAGLDVFEHEPNISADLLQLDNVILTPHTASATIETREKMSQIAAQNIIDVFEGREPMGLVKV